ncbi:hypothetical protein AYI70_g6129, partial [Smittium culicis]
MKTGFLYLFAACYATGIAAQGNNGSDASTTSTSLFFNSFYYSESTVY